MQKSLSKKERSEIFALFLENTKLKFNDIEKSLKIRSNMVSYHLTSMMHDGILSKSGEYYRLTDMAEKYIPLFSDTSESHVGPLPVILVAVLNKANTKILLIKRNKRPYKNYWSMIGGKMLLHEGIEQACLRLVKSKTGLECVFVSVNDLMHERVEGSGIVKHSFILLFAKVVASDVKFKESRSGELKWFAINNVDKDSTIPSDYALLKGSLNKRMKLKNLYMHENDGKIEKHQFL